MSVHEKLADGLRKLLSSLDSEVVSFGDVRTERFFDALPVILDDVLGVCDPKIGDVRREARRVFGDQTCTFAAPEFVSAYVGDKAHEAMTVPTIAAAYAALRTLPDHKEGA